MFNFKSCWLAALYLGSTVAFLLSNAYFASNQCNIEEKYLFSSSDGYPCSSAQFGVLNFAFLAENPILDPVYLSPQIIGIVLVVLHLRGQREANSRYRASLLVISFVAFFVSILVFFFSLAIFFGADSLSHQCSPNTIPRSGPVPKIPLGSEESRTCLQEVSSLAVMWSSTAFALGATMLALVFAYLGNLNRVSPTKRT